MRISDWSSDVCSSDLVAAGLDGGRSGVPGGGADHRDALAALPQHVVEEASEELQRVVLESQGRAVEQLHQPGALVELLQRGDGGMFETGIGLGQDMPEVAVGDAAGNEDRKSTRLNSSH